MLLLHKGHIDKGIGLAEAGNDEALIARCCLYKAHVLIAAKVKKYTGIYVCRFTLLHPLTPCYVM